MHEIRQFFASRLMEIVIIGFCVQLLVTAFAIWVGNRPSLIVISAAVLFILLVTAIGVRELHSRRRRPVIGEEKAFELPRKAVIFTLGLNSDKPGSVVDLVMNRVRPEWVGFLGTPATDQAGIVSTICQRFSLPPERIKSESWEPTEINDGRVKTLLVIDWLKRKELVPSEMVVDLTGGTATMSVAAFMAAQECEVDCQYIYSEWDRDKNLLKPGTQRPILVTRYPRQGRVGDETPDQLHQPTAAAQLHSHQ
jgi:hypothetical protein